MGTHWIGNVYKRPHAYIYPIKIKLYRVTRPAAQQQHRVSWVGWGGWGVVGWVVVQVIMLSLKIELRLSWTVKIYNRNTVIRVYKM